MIPETYPLAAEEVFQKLQQAVDIPHTALQIEADLAVRAPAFSGSVRAQITHRKADSLYATLSAALLRIEVGRLLITPDSFFYYDRLQKQLLYGPNALMDQVLPIPFVESQIFERLLGLMIPDPEESWATDLMSGRYLLTRSDARVSYTINAAHWRTVLREERASDGTLLESLRYDDFITVAGRPYPRRVVLQRPENGTVLSAFYRTVTLDPEISAFSFQVPPDVPWISAKDLIGGDD